jgi:dihydrofolate reductase
MRQRAMSAMAMACNPKVLIADEPTTALDVTIQAQIFDLMTTLKREHGTAILLITHDMGVVAEIADRTVVMLGGEVIEQATTQAIFDDAKTAYTKSLIAAVPRNGAIGKNNGLLWREPEDQKHFRRVTMGCPVIMGRKTWDSLPERFRPLPGRRNVVITRNAAWQAAGAEAASSLDAALALLAEAPKAFVIGGAELYALALPRAHELVLTEIDADLDGDTFFPRWDRSRFTETAREVRPGYSFVTYNNIQGD